MFPVPYIVGFGLISGLAWWKAGKKHEVPAELSPNLRYALQKLLDAKLPPEKYIKAAESYEAAGFRAEGIILRKRATIAALPPERKAKLTEAFSRAMESTKPEAIRHVAAVLDHIGCVGAAKNLRDHADVVEAANSVEKVHVEVPVKTPQTDGQPLVDVKPSAETESVDKTVN